MVRPSLSWLLLIGALSAPRWAAAQPESAPAESASGRAAGGEALQTTEPGGGLPIAVELTYVAPSQDYAAMPIEQLVQKAFANNPDIQVAEAKVREAEAGFRKARMLAVQRLVELHENIKSLTKQYQTIQKVHQRGVAPSIDVLAIETKLAAAKAELEYCVGENAHEQARHQPPRRYQQLGLGTSSGMGLSGQVSLGFGSSGSGDAAGSAGAKGSSPVAGADATGARVAGAPSAGVGASDPGEIGPVTTPSGAAPPSPAASKVKQRLDAVLASTGVEVDFVETPLNEAIHYLSDKLGIHILIDRPGLEESAVNPELPVTLSLHDPDLTWQDALSAFEDIHPPLRLAPRNYGLLLTTTTKLQSMALGGFGGGMGGGGFSGGGGGGGFFCVPNVSSATRPAGP